MVEQKGNRIHRQMFHLKNFYATVCHLKVTANFLPGSDAGTSVTHNSLTKGNIILSQMFHFKNFYATVCHLEVTANFLPGSDAGTSVTHNGLTKGKKNSQPNVPH